MDRHTSPQPGIRGGTFLLLLGLATLTLPVPEARAAAPARETVTRLAQKSRFRRPSPDEFRQIYAALAEKGWSSAILARVPTSYTAGESGVQVGDYQEAVLQGNVDEDDQPEWVLGLYFPLRMPGMPEAEETPFSMMARMDPARAAHDDRASIVVLKKDTSGQLKVSWRSPGLGFEFGAPRFNMREVDLGIEPLRNLRTALALVDVDGDRRLEIQYSCWSQTSSVGLLPGVYRWDRSRWVSVAPQADRFCLLDLNRDGKLELVTGSRHIGYGMGDDDVPRVWRWKDGQYQEASTEFPRYYGALARRYQDYVRRSTERGEKVDTAVWERAIQKATSLSG